ncbi:MAG: hypothetical protein ACOZF0_05715 [Thermodesulfobacteriota bacterium]
MKKTIKAERHRLWILLLLATCSASFVCPIPPAVAENYAEKIVFFGKQDEQIQVYPASLAITPDGRNIAYVAKNNKGMFACFNGKPDTDVWVKIAKGTPVFNSTGSRAAYSAYDGKKWYVIVDNQKGPAFDNVAKFMFSPDGKHFAYIGKQQKAAVIVINHKIGPKYNHIEDLVFSPDSKRFAYSVYDNDSWFVVENKLKTQKKYALAGSILYSPDSSHVSYVAKTGKNVFVVMDGVEMPITGDFIGMTTFSNDSSRFAYGINSGEKWNLVVDGVKGPDASLAIQFLFSPDSKSYAYSARFDGRERLISNGQTLFEYDSIDTIVFSQDSAHVACRAVESGNSFVVQNGKPHPKQYVNIIGPDFILGTSRLYYVGKQEDENRVFVLDGKEGKPFEGIGKPVFSNSGKRVAYTVEKGDKKFVAIDDNLLGPYDGVRHMGFSPNEKYFAFSAQQEGSWFIVINGKELNQRFYVLPTGLAVYFPSDTAFHLPIMLLKGKDPWLYRYEVQITP